MRTLIFLLLDASGSMTSKRDDVLGGVNGFVAQQKLVEGRAWVQMAQFNHMYTPMLGLAAGDINQVPTIGRDRYQPGGNTALFDAIAIGIEAAEAADRQLHVDKIVFVVATDGEENSSTRYKLEDIQRMITQRESTKVWTFIYLGASPNSFRDAGAMGFGHMHTASYHDSGLGTRSMFHNASVATMDVRAGNAVSNLGRVIAEDELPPAA